MDRKIQPEDLKAYPTFDLKAIAYSTNPKGRFADHLKVALTELKRRGVRLSPRTDT